MLNAYDETAREVIAMPRVRDLDWTRIGLDLRSGADDAHNGSALMLAIGFIAGRKR